MNSSRFNIKTQKLRSIKQIFQFRLATILLLSIVILAGAIVTAWTLGVGQIEQMFVQIHLMQENPPTWIGIPMVMKKYLLAPTVIAWVITIAITTISPQPRPWSRVLVISILLGLVIRYILWRSLSTLNVTDPLNGLFSLGLFWLEMLLLIHNIIQLFLMWGFKNRRYQAEQLSKQVLNSSYLPTVDILIPTYDEPTFILQRTIIGCQALDYPYKKIYLLDDTKRSAVEQLAHELGCEYITRPDNRHAKAGNLNYAIAKTQGELITVFDADFIPTKNFLIRTVGFFQNERVALVQTPQSFYNIDPIAHNLGLENVLTPEEEVLYRQIQPIRDAAGGVICTGTSFIVRRTALNLVGGFFTQSLTEDFFTGIRLSAQGFRLVYLDEKLSAGLAAENISAHATQRLRWARGTLQAFFVDANPLTIPGLRPLQRLAYLEGILYWFSSIPRSFFLLIPLAYSFLGVIPIKATPQELLYYFLPYYVVNLTVYSWLNYRSRSALLSDIYSLILTFPLAITVFKIMLYPFDNRFKVTPKGIYNHHFHFNWKLALPLIIMFFATALSLWQNLCICVIKGGLTTAENSQQFQGIGLGLIWSSYNLVILGIVLVILIDIPKPDIYEWFKLRRVVKIQLKSQKQNYDQRQTIEVNLPFSKELWGVTSSISEVGAEVELTYPELPIISTGETLPVIFSLPEEKISVEGEITNTGFNGEFTSLRITFGEFPLPQKRRLVEMLYCRPGQWKRQDVPGELQSLWLLLRTLLRPPVLFDRKPRGKAIAVNQI